MTRRQERKRSVLIFGLVLLLHGLSGVTSATPELETELETWYLREPVPGFGTEFRGVLHDFSGFPSERSEVFAIFWTESGALRALPIRLFADPDRERLEALRRQHVAEVEAGWPEEDAVYLPAPDMYAGHDVNEALTPHFRVVWGNNPNGSGWRFFDPAFREMNLRYLEAIWDFYAHVAGAPMPYADEEVKYKINVYITGTGLPYHAEGWAFGAQDIVIHPDAMLEGSSVIPHEFGHVLQFYSGGYRDNPYVGWFWESHANWIQFQYIPSYPAVLAHYADRAHFNLSSTRHNYGSWPFLQYLRESGRAELADLPYTMWVEAARGGGDGVRRLAGPALEDPFATIMRIGFERGVFDDPVRGFGDLIGEMAARNATWDYVYRYTMQQHAPPTYRNRTTLQPVPDRPGWYAPPYAHAPMQYGYNVIELILDDAAEHVEVTFAGLPVAPEADWRATIVMVDSRGEARYSPSWNAGTQVVERRPDDVAAYLVVAATPSEYRPIGFHEGVRSLVRYPYEVAVKGATPRGTPPDHPAPPATGGVRHPNGGGFVAHTAHVDPTVYVAETAQVLGYARVTGYARIEDYAIVRGSATVSDEAVIGGFAIVDHQATVSGAAVVRDFARLYDQVTVTGNARILEYAELRGSVTVTDHATVKGFSVVHGSGQRIGGGVIIGMNAEFWAGDWLNDLTHGFFYEYTNGPQHAVPTPHPALYASWDFSEPNAALAFDRVADNDGFLRGSPVFATVDGRSGVVLNGVDQYILLPRDVADFRRMTLALWVNWAGERSEERVFDLGLGSGMRLSLTPQGDEGVVKLLLERQGGSAAILGEAPLPRDEWVHVVVVIDEYGGELYLDGRLVGRSEAFRMPPAGAFAPEGQYLGRGGGAGHPFTGIIGGVQVYADRVAPADLLRADEAARSGLVAHWNFVDGWGDLVPHGGPRLIDGVGGRAAALDGVDDYIVLGNDPALQPSRLSLSFWIMRTGEMRYRESVIFWAKGNTDWAGPGWFLTIQDGGGANAALVLMVDGFNSFTAVGDPHEFYPLHEWVHVVVVFDGETGQARMYRNGVPQPLHVHGNPTSITATLAPKYIGFNSPGFNGAFLPAALSDIRIYNRPLADEEVAALYRQEM